MALEVSSSQYTFWGHVYNWSPGTNILSISYVYFNQKRYVYTALEKSLEEWGGKSIDTLVDCYRSLLKNNPNEAVRFYETCKRIAGFVTQILFGRIEKVMVLDRECTTITCKFDDLLPIYNFDEREDSSRL